ncbi:MAG: hypothetical protein ACW99G_12265 [Candidatus Thorarchaeota archaeon]|jgi:hypothetical protein
MIPSDNLNRRIDQTLYMLKRSFGGTINIYQMGDATVDHLTGVRTVPKTVTQIRRAIILPAKVSRDVVQTISIISANKAFVVGGNYDTGTRMFIVERSDAPNIELAESDWIVYRNQRYEIKNFDEYEFDSAWVIIGKAVKGDNPEQIYPLCADNLIRLNHSGGGTK